MDWVHCNHCFVQPGDEKGRGFFITNCSHIFCSECVLLPELKVCPLCQSAYAKVPLTAKMNKEIEQYFCDPLEDMQRQVKILEFQNSHRMRLTKHNRDKFGKYKAMKEENVLLKEQLKCCEAEKSLLRAEINRITVELSEFKKKVDQLLNYKRSCDAFASANADALRSTCSPFQAVTMRENGTKTPDVYSSKEQCSVLKRPPEGIKFFSATPSKYSTPKYDNIPKLKVQNTSSYRFGQYSASDLTNRDYFPNKNMPRKTKLPGVRGNSSSAVQAALHGLTISKLTPSPKRNGPYTSKYSYYFTKK